MRLIIIGSRTVPLSLPSLVTLDTIHRERRVSEVVIPGDFRYPSTGVNESAERWAAANSIPVKRFAADGNSPSDGIGWRGWTREQVRAMVEYAGAENGRKHGDGGIILFAPTDLAYAAYVASMRHDLIIWDKRKDEAAEQEKAAAIERDKSRTAAMSGV